MSQRQSNPTVLQMRRGQRLFQQGQYEPALEIFQPLARRTPADGAAQLWLGLTLAELCRWNPAQAALQSAVDLAPRDPVRQAFLARNYLDQGQPQPALVILQPLLEDDPPAVVRGLYGLALLQSGQVQAGLQPLMALPRPIRPLWLAARILAACEQRLLEHPGASRSLDTNTICDRAPGRFERLSDAWQGFTLRARLRLQPRSLDPRQDLALFEAEQALKAGQPAEAAQALALLDQSPAGDANRLVRQVRLLLMLKDEPAALRLVETGLRDPRWKDASILRVLQAVSLLYLRRANEAHSILTDVYAKGGAFGFVEYNLGLCQLAESGPKISPEELAAARARFAKVIREYSLYHQTDLCRLRLAELARVMAN